MSISSAVFPAISSAVNLASKASLSLSSFSFLRNFSLSLSQAASLEIRDFPLQPHQPSVGNLLRVNAGFFDSNDGVNIDDAFY